MKTIINPETERIMGNRFTLGGGHVNVKIIGPFLKLRWLVSWMALHVIFVKQLTIKLRI